MNFDLSEERTLLKDSISRYVRDNYELESRIKHSQSPRGFSAENWNSIAELGWLALPFSEEEGGIGGNQIDTMVIMEEFGKGMVLEPYFASIVLGAGAMRRGASDDMKETMFEGIIDGSKQLALAYAEPQARFDLHDVVTTAKQEGEDFVLNGNKCVVQNAESASHIVVSARTSGGQIDSDGISLFLIDVNTEGLELLNYPTVDGLRASEITLTNVRVSKTEVIGEVGEGFVILQAVANDAILALAAEAIGTMEMLYTDTIEYTQQRVQFDQMLSDFQVLQHRMVDMFMEYEQCKSLLYRATLEVAENSKGAQRSVHALKHLIGKAGTFIAENAVQLHGGMGMTEELRIGHFFKRLAVIDMQFGNSDYHLEKFAG
jgi:alkylation response protein AidB-like acyl-CoA dehydrogenase